MGVSVKTLKVGDEDSGDDEDEEGGYDVAM